MIYSKFSSYYYIPNSEITTTVHKLSHHRTYRHFGSAIFKGLSLFLSANQLHPYKYRGADKSLARPGRKQARKHVRDPRDFNNIETRAVIIFFPLQGKEPKKIHAILTETLACFLPGRAKDLSAPLYKILHLNLQGVWLMEQRRHGILSRNEEPSFLCAYISRPSHLLLLLLSLLLYLIFVNHSLLKHDSVCVQCKNLRG